MMFGPQLLLGCAGGWCWCCLCGVGWWAGVRVVVGDGRRRVDWGTSAFANRRTCLGCSPLRHRSYGRGGRRGLRALLVAVVAVHVVMLLKHMIRIRILEIRKGRRVSRPEGLASRMRV